MLITEDRSEGEFRKPTGWAGSMLLLCIDIRGNGFGIDDFALLYLAFNPSPAFGFVKIRTPGRIAKAFFRCSNSDGCTEGAESEVAETC